MVAAPTRSTSTSPPSNPTNNTDPSAKTAEPWTVRQAFIDICVDDRHNLDTAIARRRQLRELNIDPATHEAREAGPELAPLDQPANESNALLRAELARLRVPTISRADDGFGLGF